jgi:ribonuclease BN (tRNA processing enzyme)
MRITVLGAGSIVASPERFSSGLLVESEGTRLLLDLGPGVLEKLRKLGLDPHLCTAFLVTHFHIDHVSDLLPLIMMWPYKPDGIPDQSPKPLRIIGPKGLKKLIKTLTEDVEAFRYLSETMGCRRYLNLWEMGDNGRHELETIAIKSAAVEHYGGVAYRLETEEGTVVFSGDTVPDPALTKLAKGCDVLVHECSFPHEFLIGKHTSDVQLAKIAAEVMPRVLIVTHLYPVWTGLEHRLLKSLGELGLEKVVIAKDGDIIEL